MATRKLPVFISIVAAAGVFFSSADTPAQTRPMRPHMRPHMRPMPTAMGFSLRLEDGMGNALSSFMHQGQTFVLGREGERFEVVLTNPTGRRVEAVVSVDGRDAVNGRMASNE